MDLNLKKQNHQQLLLLYRRMLSEQESCLTNFFRFQHSNVFRSFQEKFKMGMALRLRLDDIIYLILLSVIVCVFCLILSDSSHALSVSFRQGCVLYILCSVLQLLLVHWVKYLLLSLLCLFYPLLVLAGYQEWIRFDPVASGTSLYTYLGQLSLIGVYLLVLCVYPLKEYIRNNIGAIYSYLYALSFSTLFVIWPCYSLVEELITNNSITFNFITQNTALIIAFLSIFILIFTLVVHGTFNQPQAQYLKQILMDTFTSQELSNLLTNLDQNQYCLYNNFNLYTRSMSFVIFGTTLGAEIYLLLHLVDHIEQVSQTLGLMVFMIIFLMFGCAIDRVKISNVILIPVCCTVSLIPAYFSPLYFSTLTTAQYWVIIVSPAFSTIFWCVIRSMGMRRAMLRLFVLMMLYIFVYIPLLVYSTSLLGIKNSNIIGLICLIISAISTGIGMIMAPLSIVLSVSSHKSVRQVNMVTLDYDYQDQSNPQYENYSKNVSLGISWLQQMDQRPIGYMFCGIVYTICTLASIITINYIQLSSIEIIYAQIPIVVIFYVYSIFYIYNQPIREHYALSIVLVIFGIIAIGVSYAPIVSPFTYRVAGSFLLVLGITSIPLHYIKITNLNISKFLNSVLIMVIWTFLLIPYVIIIPILYLLIDETNQGEFIYYCIMSSVLMMVILVGIISFLFNSLMNRYEEQRKYKFVMGDVKTFFDQEGVQSTDQILHILYESYECREKAYIYFLRRGYPINIQLAQNPYLILYNQLQNKVQEVKDNSDDCFLKFLTFCCGKDEEQIQQNFHEAIQNKRIDQNQLQALAPLNFAQSILSKTPYQNKKQIIQKKHNLTEVYSSKSLTLNNLRKTDLLLGDQYALLKTSKDKKLVIEIWNKVFQFLANDDYVPQQIIYNDFIQFGRICSLFNDKNVLNEAFSMFAHNFWGDFMGMDINDFAVSIEWIGIKLYPNMQGLSTLQKLLIDKVYYQLCNYQEFQQHMQSFMHKKSIQINNNAFIQAYNKYKLHYQSQYQQVDNFQQLRQEQRNLKALQVQKVPKQRYEQDKKQQQKQKNKSCKQKIYQWYKQYNCCNCFKKIVEKQQNTVIHKIKIKPWNYLSVQSIKILANRQTQWKSQHQKVQHKFRLILNNFVVALFKISDLYIYLQITLRDNQIGWISNLDFQIFFLQYRIQLYICFILVLICVPMGLKGIFFILEDKLGLTQSRVPAKFPHPMYFFTILYKGLILALFVTISSTLLSTFNCTWTQTNFVLISDPSLNCFSAQHNIYMIVSLLTLFAYYPLSAYTMPNFQFAQKSLDLKFKPVYLVIYFQVNFMLLFGKVLIGLATSSFYLQLVFIVSNICCLLLLSICVLVMKPCLITWFNYIELLVIVIGIIFNVIGLLLYLTKLWVLCIVLVSFLTCITIIITTIYIKKIYFSDKVAAIQDDDEKIRQLEQGWQYRNQKNISLVQNNKQTELYFNHNPIQSKFKNQQLI